MKKYVKPEVYFEEFELSQQIAACGWDMVQADPLTCQAVAAGDVDMGLAGLAIFQGTTCPQGYVEMFDYCYMNGVKNTDQTRVFQS